MHTYRCIQICTYIYIYIYIHMQYIYVHIHTQIHMQLHVLLYVYACHVCIYIDWAPAYVSRATSNCFSRSTRPATVSDFDAPMRLASRTLRRSNAASTISLLKRERMRQTHTKDGTRIDPNLISRAKSSTHINMHTCGRMVSMPLGTVPSAALS